MGTSVHSDYFELVASFPVVVPEDYDHATRLATFKRKHGSEFAYYDSSITDYELDRSMRLSPGRRFTVKIFKTTLEEVHTGACLWFIRENGGALVGVQGLTLVYEQGRDQLPRGHWYTSFGEESRSEHGLMCVKMLMSDDVKLYEFILVHNLYRNDRFLCFCEE